MSRIPRLLFLVALAGFGSEGLPHGEIHERVQGMNRRIAENPTEPMLYLLRADLYREHRDWESALTDIRHARELAADDPNVEYYQAALSRDRGQLVAAARHLNRYLERAPVWPGTKVPLPKARRSLAGILIEQGRPCEAAGQYDHAIGAAKQPTPQLYLSRAELFAQCTPPRFQVALRGLDEGIARFGTGAGVLEDYAITLELARGAVELALQRIDARIARAPERPTAWIRRAEILERAGRHKDALAAYRQASAAVLSLPQRAQAARSTHALRQRIDEDIDRLGGILGPRRERPADEHR